MSNDSLKLVVEVDTKLGAPGSQSTKNRSVWNGLGKRHRFCKIKASGYEMLLR